MKRATKFSVSPAWLVLLRDMQIDASSVLTRAALPLNLFSKPHAALTPAEFFRFWQSMEYVAGDREVPLLVAQHLSVEAFDPPIFASICSENLNAALHRLKQYKPLIGPMDLLIDENPRHTALTLKCHGYAEAIPRSLTLCELVFFTQLARLATRETIRPLRVEVTEMPTNLEEYEAFFGCTLSLGAAPTIIFSSEDANKPFVTHNAAMWAFFEDKLNRLLGEVGTGASMAEQVRAVLLEALPSGESSAEYVAGKLAISKRTLQRKLTAEAETYQNLLQTIRLELADHYLQKSDMSLGEISFLLGFQEANSFIRAYSTWKGTPPASFRATQHRVQ